MFITKPVLLTELLGEVSSGEIQLPDFQRGWVWDDEHIVSLLASISRGFPVGAIMTLAAGGDIKFMPRPIEGVSVVDKSPETFLLDGQQRLTSLYQSLLYPGPVDTVDGRKRRFKRRYYVDMRKAVDPTVDRDDVFISVPEDRRILKNFGREVDLDLSSPELEYEHHMMPTERLFDNTNWMFGYRDYWQRSNTPHPEGDVGGFWDKFKKQVINPFINYLLPAIQLGKGTPKEAVCIVFEKVNTGGVTLSVFELVTATFAADDFRLRDDWAARKARLHEAYGVLQGVEADQFLQIVALLATYDKREQFLSAEGEENQNQAPGISCKRDSILNLKLEEYKRWADKVEAGLKEAARFLNRQFIFKNKDIPYSTQIVPLAALFVELGDELKPAKAQEKLERWFWSGVFGESYGSNTETQFARDLPQVVDYVRGGSEKPTSVMQANFTPERLLALRTRNSAAYKGLYAFQMKSGAADWRTGEPLTFSTWHSEWIDIHHIFPKAWCRSQEIPPRLYDSIINKTPIDADTNRKKVGARAPSIYLRLLEQDIDSGQLDRILADHWLRPELLRADNFAECFVERGMKMLELIGGAMGKPIHGGREVFRDALASAGLDLEEQFDDTDPEYDEVGDQLHQEAAA